MCSEFVWGLPRSSSRSPASMFGVCENVVKILRPTYSTHIYYFLQNYSLDTEYYLHGQKKRARSIAEPVQSRRQATPVGRCARPMLLTSAATQTRRIPYS